MNPLIRPVEINPNHQLLLNSTNHAQKQAESNQNNHAITFDSADLPEKNIQELFAKVSEESFQAILQKPQEDKKLLRAQRKAERAQKKSLAASNKPIYNVIIPENRILTGLNLSKLRFSQDSIQATTSDGKPLEQLIQDIATKGWKKGTSLVLVEMPNGKLVSLNNRRLFAAKKAAEIRNNLEVPAMVFKHDDKAPRKLLNGIATEYKKNQKDKDINAIAAQIQPESYGHAATLRINTRQGDLSNSIYGHKQTIVRR